MGACSELCPERSLDYARDDGGGNRAQAFAIGRIAQDDAELALDAVVPHAAVLGIEGARHGAHGRCDLAPTGWRAARAGRAARRRRRSPRCSTPADRRRRCRSRRAANGHRGEHRGGDVLDMDAREDLAGLVDAPRGAGLDLVDGAAAGTVDSGQPEDIEARRSCANPARRARRPAVRCCAAGRAGGSSSRRPSRRRVAIDAGRREISQPARARRSSAPHAVSAGSPAVPGAIVQRMCASRRRARSREGAPCRRTAVSIPSAPGARPFPRRGTVPAHASLPPRTLGDFKAAVAQAENEKTFCHLVRIAPARFFSTMLFVARSSSFLVARPSCAGRARPSRNSRAPRAPASALHRMHAARAQRAAEGAADGGEMEGRGRRPGRPPLRGDRDVRGRHGPRRPRRSSKRSSATWAPTGRACAPSCWRRRGRPGWKPTRRKMPPPRRAGRSISSPTTPTCGSIAA